MTLSNLSAQPQVTHSVNSLVNLRIRHALCFLKPNCFSESTAWDCGINRSKECAAFEAFGALSYARNLLRTK